MRRNRIKNRAATVLVFLMLCSIYGAGKIYAIAENIAFNADVFSADTDQDYGGVKYNERKQNDAKKAVKSILDSGVNTRVSRFSGEEGVIVCYTRNVYIELDAFSMHPTYLIYECKAENPKYTLDDCQRIALRFAFRNMPRRMKANDSTVQSEGVENNVALYQINFSNGRLNVAVRMDTGSVVFYDVSEDF